MAYPNGQIPLSLMLPIATGTNRDGYWEHRLAPGQKRRWEALVADVLANEGVRLKITDGWNAYRPLDAQWTAYRNNPPGMAAYPGTSSHGGRYNGRDAMAIDVANWGLLGQPKFYSYARKHGFTAGAISNEPWHIIDYNPWVVPAGGGATPLPTPEVVKEDSMTHSISVNGNLYGVGEEFISHYGDVRQAQITRQVTSATDELHVLSGTSATADFAALLDGLGIPRSVLDGQGRVLNPESGKHETNGVWSRRREAVAKLNQLLAR